MASAHTRSASWQPVRLAGSARLSLDELDQIVLPAEAEAKLRASVEDLQAVFADRVAGSTLSLSSTARMSAKQSIVLQLREPHDSSGAFSIRRERSRVVIEAASQAGLSNGIYALCEQVLGARWYWSGELGLEYVGSVPSKFPETRWAESPAFIQRALYPIDTDYGRRNRLNRTFQFNHALAKVFTAERYEAQPEVFSQVHGRQRRPKGSGAVDPQPNLAHPGAVELAAAAALRHFEEQPSSRSFSLSINDNVLFDETEPTQRLVEPLKYFRTRPDYTDYVFGFMNAVAAKVFDQGGAWQNADGEDRYLTALSYYWTEPSPTIRIHPRVMPVLTSDRAQWHDPAYRAEDKALIERWAGSGAERVGTWDYYFGAPYPYPRQFNQWMIESIRYLHDQGVDVFFSQLPSAWGMDGAKAWLAAQLLWNPRRDAAALLDEYYTQFFGTAAEPIRRFYERAEAHRNAMEGRADWIKFYKDEAGVGLFTEAVLVEMRDLLDEALERVASDSRRRARVEVVAEAFRFTECYAAFHRARNALVQAALSRDAATARRLEVYTAAREQYRNTADAVIAQPMQARLNSFSRQLQTDPRAMALVALAEQGALPESEDAYGLNAWVRDAAVFSSVISNPDLALSGTYQRNFLGPVLPVLSGWYFDFRPAEHLRVSPAKASDQGVHVSGADVFSIFRDVPVMPERNYLLDTELAWKISPDNRTQVKLIWTDRNGAHLRTELPLQLPWGDSKGGQRVVIPFRSPKNAYDVRIHFVASRQYEGDFLELQRVDFGMLNAR